MTGRGMWVFDELELARLMDLPEGQRVTCVNADFPTRSIYVSIEGDGLPEVEPGMQAPIVGRGVSIQIKARFDAGKFPENVEEIVTDAILKLRLKGRL